MLPPAKKRCKVTKFRKISLSLPAKGWTAMRKIIRFVKDWTLPVAIVTGASAYGILAGADALAFTRPFLWEAAKDTTPVLIFTMLFLTFCKIDPRDMRPRPWNWWLLLVQTLLCVVLLVMTKAFALTGEGLLAAEGFLACLLAPTATAAAVISAKLESNAAATSVHSLIDSLWVAALIPIFCPLFEADSGVSFAALVMRILANVSPLLILPLVLSWVVRYALPRVHRFLIGLQDAAFYLWAVTLVIVSAQTMSFMVHAPGGMAQVVVMFSIAFVCCFGQFYIGRRIGLRYGDKIAAGQSLGQKNTVFAIWFTYSFLSPAAAIAPGAHVVWQNIFNAWQMWRHRKAAAIKQSPH